MPFVGRRHVEVCVDSRVDVAVLAFGETRSLLDHLRQAGIFVFVMVGTKRRHGALSRGVPMG